LELVQLVVAIGAPIKSQINIFHTEEMVNAQVGWHI